MGWADLLRATPVTLRLARVEAWSRAQIFDLALALALLLTSAPALASGEVDRGLLGFGICAATARLEKLPVCSCRSISLADEASVAKLQLG